MASRDPDLVGPAGRAWRVDSVPHPPYPPPVALWALECPGQSPAWSWYRITVVTLADHPGIPPAVLRFPDATHELMLLALSETPDLDGDPAEWPFLTPVNAVEQVKLPDDATAARLAELAASAVVTGFLPAEPPLAGAVEPWHSSIADTAAHLRGEGHAR